MTVRSYAVSGMTCGHCVHAVSEEIGALSGVSLGTGAFSSVISTGGVNGIGLTTVLGGTLTIAGGSLSGSSGSAFLISGGGPTVSYGGTITQNTAGLRAVDIQSDGAGTVSLLSGSPG